MRLVIFVISLVFVAFLVFVVFLIPPSAKVADNLGYASYAQDHYRRGP